MGVTDVSEFGAKRCVVFGEKVREMSMKEKRLVMDQASEREKSRMWETG